MAKQDDYVRYTIRVPKDAYAAIEKAATEANRSVNSEIVQRLADSRSVAPNQLHLSIPEELASPLSVFASAHSLSPEEYILKALRAEMFYEPRNEPPIGSEKYLWVELQRTSQDVMDLQAKLARAEKERDEALDTLRDRDAEMERSKILLARKEGEVQLLETNRSFETLLLFSQLLSFNTFLRQVVEKGEAIPSGLRQSAEQHLRSTEKVIAEVDASDVLAPKKQPTRKRRDHKGEEHG